jgi:hypothetical protein
MPIKSRASTDFTSNSFDQTSFKREGLTNTFNRLHTVGSIRATTCIGESTGKPQRVSPFDVSQLHKPRVTYTRFPGCWFLYDGKLWSVKECPTSVLKATLRKAVIDESALDLLNGSQDLDLVSRWYLWCEARTVPLFESQEKALQALELKASH